MFNRNRKPSVDLVAEAAAEQMGWFISPDNASAYFRFKENPEKLKFAKQGIGPEDIVWLTSKDEHARAVQAFAWNAVRRLAEGTHQISTEAEIAQAEKDAVDRAAMCEAQTRLTANQGTLRSTAAFAEAAAMVGPRKRG